MGASLQPVAATAQKVPESLSLLVGVANWLNHLQVWGRYK